jgi:hypothetical protein
VIRQKLDGLLIQGSEGLKGLHFREIQAVSAQGPTFHLHITEALINDTRVPPRAQTRPCDYATLPVGCQKRDLPGGGGRIASLACVLNWCFVIPFSKYMNVEYSRESTNSAPFVQI